MLLGTIKLSYSLINAFLPSIRMLKGRPIVIRIKTLKLLLWRGYIIVTYIEWVKLDVSGKLRHYIGKYFSHTFEECIVGVKGKYEDL